MSTSNFRPCSIEQVGKQRNGRPRFWCSAHQAPATGRFGVRLERCESAYRDIDYSKVFDLNVEAFPGGVALWGAVPPVFDTTGLPAETGIHVHARKETAGDKEIDDTYDAVRMKYRRDLLNEGETVITRDTAVNFYISRFLKRDVRHLFCIHCGELHLDADYFAVHPHRTHLCHGCGKLFKDSTRSISNPIALLQFRSGAPVPPKPIRPKRKLIARQSEYPGGIQIWASNPAFVWTAERPEEEGLHIHAYDKSGKRVVDDTYGSVVLDGERLDEGQVQHFMAQSSLAYLKNKVVALHCSSCGTAQFDEGEDAVTPRETRPCRKCGNEVVPSGRRKLVVSNPFVEIRERLLSNAQCSTKPPRRRK